MKKMIVTLAAVCVAACCLGACGKSESENYDSLDEMMQMHYSEINVTVTDTFDEETSLKSEYKVSYSEESVTVTYTVEKFSELSLDGSSSDYKTTLKGEAVIENGEIVSVSGDEVDLPLAVTKPAFKFKRKYFTNVQLGGVYFIADVKESGTSGFFGTALPCFDMKVKVTFLEVLHDMRVTYKVVHGNEVEYKYTFTK